MLLNNTLVLYWDPLLIYNNHQANYEKVILLDFFILIFKSIIELIHISSSEKTLLLHYGSLLNYLALCRLLFYDFQLLSHITSIYIMLLRSFDNRLPQYYQFILPFLCFTLFITCYWVYPLPFLSYYKISYPLQDQALYYSILLALSIFEGT